MIFHTKDADVAVREFLLIALVALYIFISSFSLVHAVIGDTDGALITEIMYNPESTDTGREWIEVYNSSTTAIDLTTYKFIEGGTAHKITASTVAGSGNATIAVGEYAIIADNPEKFLLDFPDFAEGGELALVAVFDSAFSLNNNGEELILQNASGAVVDTATYTPDLGANGTGNTLQLNSLNFEEAFWIPAEPTPGTENATEAADESADSGGSGDAGGSSDPDGSGDSEDGGSAHSDQVEISVFNPKPSLKISIGRDRYVTINTPVDFQIIHNRDSDRNIRAIWSFGDGRSRRGIDAKHFFGRIGTYNIVVNAKDGREQAVSRTRVIVTEPSLTVSVATTGLEITNTSKKEINLGGFTIKNSRKKYEIIKDTILSPNQTLVLDEEMLDFNLPTEYFPVILPKPIDKNNFEILIPDLQINYPNGQNLWKYHPML